MQRCSTPTLSRVLNQILMHHIRVCLPEIKNRITSMSIEISAEIEALGQPTDSMHGARLGGILLTLLSNYTNNFTSAIEGKGLNTVGVDKESELYGGARISFIFTEIFGQSLYSLSPFDGLTDDDIRTGNAHLSRR
jgi:dynamin 1-like protein